MCTAGEGRGWEGMSEAGEIQGGGRWGGRGWEGCKVKETEK